MRLDFPGSGRKLVDAALEADLFTIGGLEDEGGMGIGDGRLLQIDLDRVWPLLIKAFHLNRDSRAMRAVPFQLFLLVDIRPVLRSVN